MIQPGSASPFAEEAHGGLRYSLPALLRDVQREREASALAMEKLEQGEITRLFRQNRPRRAPKPRQ